MGIHFMSLAEVMLIYEDQIRRYDGRYGVRDISLLSSALHVPMATFDGKYLHETIEEMAAAYAWHISGNHPLIDGNKRVALATALVFLDINGYDFDCGEEEIYELMMAVARGEMPKAKLAEAFKRFIKKR